MGKYNTKIKSLNGGEDVVKKKLFKGEVNWQFEPSLESLSLDGIFNTAPIKTQIKQPLKERPKEIELKRKRKKGNELI
jgi:hypothetical protein